MRAQTAAVLFDLDGTLVDAFRDIAAAVNHGLSRRGLPTRSVEDVTSLVGAGIHTLCERAAPGLRGHELESLVEDVRGYYAAHPVDRSVVYDGIPTVLGALRSAGVRTAVLSNKPHDLTLTVCQRLGLFPLLDYVQGEAAPRVPKKPDPAGARWLMGLLRAGRGVVVGDMVQDADLAAALGVPFIGVRWGAGSVEELAARHPIALVERPVELTSIILGAVGAAPNPKAGVPT